MAQVLDHSSNGIVAPPVRPGMAILVGDGAFAMRAVGTVEHQTELQQIAGDIAPGGDHLCGALLIPDPKNPFDPHAVAVVIASHVIGYLQNDAAPTLKLSMRAGGFIAAGCAARIVEERGRLGVRLDASRPFNLRPIAKETKMPPAAPPPAPAVARESERLSPPVAPAAPFERPAPPAPFATRPVAPAPSSFAREIDPAPTPPFSRDIAPPVVPPPIPPRLDREPVEERVPEEVDLRPSLMRRLVMGTLQLVAIAVILTGAYWWLKSLPREAATTPPAQTATPAAPSTEAASAPADSGGTSTAAPSGGTNGQFQWPDPPPAFRPATPATAPAPQPSWPQQNAASPQQQPQSTAGWPQVQPATPAVQQQSGWPTPPSPGAQQPPASPPITAETTPAEQVTTPPPKPKKKKKKRTSEEPSGGNAPMKIN